MYPFNFFEFPRRNMPLRNWRTTFLLYFLTKQRVFVQICWTMPSFQWTAYPSFGHCHRSILVSIQEKNFFDFLRNYAKLVPRRRIIWTWSHCVPKIERKTNTPSPSYWSAYNNVEIGPLFIFFLFAGGKERVGQWAKNRPLLCSRRQKRAAGDEGDGSDNF